MHLLGAATYRCLIFNAYTEVEKDFMRLVIVTFEAAVGGRQNPDRNGTQADAKKQQERYVQRDVQTNAEAKDHAEV